MRSWVDPTLDRVRPGRPGRRSRVRPTVKDMAIEVLKDKKNGMTAAQIKEAILERHPHRDNDTFYNQVFIAVTRKPEFKETPRQDLRPQAIENRLHLQTRPPQPCDQYQSLKSRV